MENLDAVVLRTLRNWRADSKRALLATVHHVFVRRRLGGGLGLRRLHRG